MIYNFKEEIIKFLLNILSSATTEKSKSSARDGTASTILCSFSERKNDKKKKKELHIKR